jgi:hypothetical protein
MNVPCKAQSVGISGFVRCLEETPSRCSFAFPLGSAHFCISHYRLQIAKWQPEWLKQNQQEKRLNKQWR